MAASIGSRMCLRCPTLKNLSIQRTSPVLSCLSQQQVRERHSKHYEPKWRKLRAQKVLKMNIPDWNKLRREANYTPEEMRREMKKRGILPPRTFNERQILISSTSSLFEEYVPPEGDGLASLVSGAGAKQRMTELEKKGKSYMQLRKIRQFDEEFDTKTFPDDAQEIYIKSNKLLENYKDNEDQLHDLVTEKAYPEMIYKLDHRTLRWEFIKTLEPPRVVHIRTTHLISKENVYAQVTVRLHTQQSLALYDRFGRLMYGGENLLKDCLEYVVYEKHLSDEYGRWRVHGKVIPSWMPAPPGLFRTMRQPHFEPVEEDDKAAVTETKTKPEEGSGDRTLATA